MDRDVGAEFQDGAKNWDVHTSMRRLRHFLQLFGLKSLDKLPHVVERFKL